LLLFQLEYNNLKLREYKKFITINYTKLLKLLGRGNIVNKLKKYQWYQKIYELTPKIHEEARAFARKLGLDKLKDDIGMYAGSSSRPGNLPSYVLNEIVKANQSGKVLTLRSVEDELRDVVKSVYGDDYDAAAANTCEAAIRISMSTLFQPPTMRLGDAYRGRVIMPYAEDIEWIGGYGRAFPPRYKNLLVDRTVAGGELGVEGKSLFNLDVVHVRMVGASYDCHGVRWNPTPLLTKVNADKTAERIAKAAERHAGNLVGFAAIGYDTPSYGHGELDENGTPILLKKISEFAEDYEVPFLVDAGSSIPFIGVSPRDIGCDVITYSMDKAGRAPCSGLIIGKEESMSQIRKGMGLGGQRYGEVSSHGKAVYTFSDPGRDTVVGLVAYLKTLRDKAYLIKNPIDRFHEIIVEEFKAIEPAEFYDKLIFTKTYQLGGTEINYERTWDGKNRGIPIYTLEDLWADTNPIVSAQAEMNVEPATIYAGKMFLGPGLGTLDTDGNLIEEYARLAAKSLVGAINIVNKYAGLCD
jgi:hypothetical protein